jgi:hypothetical protein
MQYIIAKNYEKRISDASYMSVVIYIQLRAKKINF